ncbi:MAG: Rne/Rng family ribonuclease [Candidatus Omnitrophica bacterium]|jgi:ribonuclease G|nr:Rne/Rng family ribonuclease [Candidatus Omnitrophota bacterium]MDD5078297.1 Rne/Rng family ribonuclease [Candidatus Omnitrophota bacterium]MDD5725671.1 Rne/Rng family ribonuclease [Candidatus Omnitrophota bacterium]
MSKEILINSDLQEKRVAIVQEGQLLEFHIERPQDRTIVGNIYKGRIEAVMPSIGAAFVDIGLPKNGFLYLSEIESAYESIESTQQTPIKEVKKGQEVLVQVVKESFGTKGPRLSTQIGLAGRYLVIMPLEKQVGISRRIEDEPERRRLRDIFKKLKLPDAVGFIVRTAASGRSEQELVRDAQFLYKLWKRLEKTAQGKKAPALVYEEYDLPLRAIRDSFTEDVTKLIVDSKPEFYRIRHFMHTFLSYLSKRVELYRGDDLFTAKDVEKQINHIYETHVYMKSKAYLIIEPTEGLVVIDVNSGGFKKKVNQEDMAFKVNAEAAVEIARQLVLRDLGGIIVIDFIDMEREGHRRELLNIFKNALSGDRAKYDIMGISKFGLVEMTRERIHKTVQMLSFSPCPYCKGRGKLRSPQTLGIFALKELKRYLKGKNLKQVSLNLAPPVVDEILKDKEAMRSIEHKYRIKINLIPNPSAHLEDIKIS